MCAQRRKETLSDTVINKLEEMITTNMKAGDRLPTEKVLEEMFSVGRSTIRESLKVLSSKGLIIRKSDGTFVSDRVKDCLIAPLDLLVTMDIGQIDDLLELREMLEVSMLDRAIDRADEDDIKNMERILWQMQNPDLKREEAMVLDTQLHCTFAKAAGNTILTELVKAVRLVITKNLDYMSEVTLKRDDAVDTHKMIIEAFKERDKEKAITTMKKHLSVFDVQKKKKELPDKENNG